MHPADVRFGENPRDGSLHAGIGNFGLDAFALSTARMARQAAHHMVKSDTNAKLCRKWNTNSSAGSKEIAQRTAGHAQLIEALNRRGGRAVRIGANSVMLPSAASPDGTGSAAILVT